MKKSILPLLVLTVLFGLYSCSGSDNDDFIPEPPEPVDPKEYIVSFGFTGEITNITETPLGRAASNDLYGIQVYSAAVSSGEYKPYAYGLFDDKSNISIKLLEGYKYKFESTMIVDGKNRVYNEDGKYLSPFYADERVSIRESFVYSTNKKMYGLASGGAGLKIDGIYEIPGRPNLDRYYGVTLDYIPTESGSVSINMKRVVFGVKVVADGLTGGWLKITLEEAPAMYIIYPESEFQDIFTFNNTTYPSDGWTYDDYTESIGFSVSWEKEDGASIPLTSQTIEFKRNKLTTITLLVKDNSTENGVDISNENTPMGDGGSIVIDGGDGTDTGVEL